jgi:hypothetical protein
MILFCQFYLDACTVEFVYSLDTAQLVGYIGGQIFGKSFYFRVASWTAFINP